MVYLCLPIELGDFPWQTVSHNQMVDFLTENPKGYQVQQLVQGPDSWSFGPWAPTLTCCQGWALRAHLAWATAGPRTGGHLGFHVPWPWRGLGGHAIWGDAEDAGRWGEQQFETLGYTLWNLSEWIFFSRFALWSLGLWRWTCHFFGRFQAEGHGSLNVPMFHITQPLDSIRYMVY